MFETCVECQNRSKITRAVRLVERTGRRYTTKIHLYIETRSHESRKDDAWTTSTYRCREMVFPGARCSVTPVQIHCLTQSWTLAGRVAAERCAFVVSQVRDQSILHRQHHCSEMTRPRHHAAPSQIRSWLSVCCRVFWKKNCRTWWLTRWIYESTSTCKFSSYIFEKVFFIRTVLSKRVHCARHCTGFWGLRCSDMLQNVDKKLRSTLGTNGVVPICQHGRSNLLHSVTASKANLRMWELNIENWNWKLKLCTCNSRENFRPDPIWRPCAEWFGFRNGRDLN